MLSETAHIEMVIANARARFADLIRAAVLTGARLDELAKSQRWHFGRERKVGKRNKLCVIDLEDGAEDFGFRLFSNLPAAIETKPCSGTGRRRASARRASLPPEPTARYRAIFVASWPPPKSRHKNRHRISGRSASTTCGRKTSHQKVLKPKVGFQSP